MTLRCAVQRSPASFRDRQSFRNASTMRNLWSMASEDMSTAGGSLVSGFINRDSGSDFQFIQDFFQRPVQHGDHFVELFVRHDQGRAEGEPVGVEAA